MWSAVRRGDAATVRERLAAGGAVDEADGEGGGSRSHPTPQWVPMLLVVPSCRLISVRFL